MTTTDARPQIAELLARYAWSHDSRNFAALAALFTDDAEYTMRIADRAPNAPTTGGEAIAALVRSFKATQTDQRRHVITNVVVDELDDDAGVARVRSYVTVFATEGDESRLVTTGVCADDVVRTEQGWRFTRKAMHLDKGF